MSTSGDAVLSRLESVVARLEAHAHKLMSGVSSSLSSSAHASSSAAADAHELTPGAAAWKELEANQLKAFVDAASRTKDTTIFGEWANTSFHHVGTLLSAASGSKKPSSDELLSFLQPVVTVMQASGNPDNRSPLVNHQKAFAEGIQSLQWVTNSPEDLPKNTAKGGLEAADFYLIKLLKDAKTKGGKEGEDMTAFATTFKALLSTQLDIVTAHYKTGLEWNPKGKSLAEAGAAGSASTSSSFTSSDAPPPPPPPSMDSAIAAGAPAKSGAVGLGAVFGELTSKNVTGGLKKVTDNMKTKNMKDAPVLDPKAKAPAANTTAAAATATKAATPAVKKEPKTHLNKGTWFVEDYDGGNVTLDNVELKENVYILKCKNTAIRVPAKCKSIQVDGCHKVQVEFKNIVSIFEIFNSQRVTIFCTENCPSVAIDKSGGVSINLNRTAVANPPQMITSSVTEVNLVVPGKTDDDDPIEIPLPEQYLTTFSNGKLATEAVAHSAN